MAGKGAGVMPRMRVTRAHVKLKIGAGVLHPLEAALHRKEVGRLPLVRLPQMPTDLKGEIEQPI